MGRMQSSVRNRQGKYVKKFYRWGEKCPVADRDHQDHADDQVSASQAQVSDVTMGYTARVRNVLGPHWQRGPSMTVTHSLPSTKGRTQVTLCYYCTHILSSPVIPLLHPGPVWVKSLDSNFRLKFFSLFNCCSEQRHHKATGTSRWVPSNGYCLTSRQHWIWLLGMTFTIPVI